MKLIQSILTKNPCYIENKKIVPKGLMLHSVGTPQPKASAFIEYWNSKSFDAACVHAFIDANSGIVYQTLPWNHRGWHGGGTSNNTHIGVEMCEPDCIKYTGGATFVCSNKTKAKEYVTRTYNSAVELFAMLCKKYKLDPLKDGVIVSHSEGYKRGIACNHADPEHLWKGLGLPYTMDGFRKAVKKAMTKTNTTTSTTRLKATQLKGLTEAKVVAKMGPIFTADQKKSGILASVSMAQFILESGYGSTELAQNANNCFGMKTSLSGNTWRGSTWDKKSVYKKKTQEYRNGKYETITADFRKYSCVEDSIADHSAYLLGAMNGSKKRYDGLKGMTDYKKAVTLIKNGGYATDPKYVSKLCNIIEKWNLTKYDIKVTASTSKPGSTTIKFPAVPFMIRVNNKNYEYREKASSSSKIKGKTGIGSFTIVKVTNGWGKLKSGAGWLNLMNTSAYTFVNSTTRKATTNSATKKSNEEIAKEVIKGLWGNGNERKEKLTKSGYNYDAIQGIVDKLMS